MIIEQLKSKLSNRGSLSYMAYKVLQSKLLAGLLGLISTIIIVRYLPKDDFGLYTLILVYFSFFEILLSATDSALVRFIPVSGKVFQHQLISTILLIKTILLIENKNYVAIIANVPKIFSKIV